jgi:hypothetical protein
MAKGQSGQMIVRPSADSVLASAQAAAKKGPPPVHLWNPPFCGDLDIRIARDGTWFYLGTPIGRPGMVALFSSILKKEDGRYYLVTPVEKVGIRVDDAPFVAVDFEVEGEGRDQVLTFVTQVEDRAVAGPDHPIRVERDASGAPAPYILIRSNLEALIDRKSFYRLVDLGTVQLVDAIRWFGVESLGTFFPIIPESDLALGEDHA